MGKEILVITSNKNPSAAAKIAGIYRYAKNSPWKVQVVAAPAKPAEVHALLELWRPDGCIFESGLTGQVPEPKTFNGYRTVFLDADRRLLPKGAATVIHDSESDGRLAAKELLAIGRSSFAFVGATDEVFWSRDRESAFIKTLRLNGIFDCQRLHPRATYRDELKLSREIAAFVRTLPDGCGIFAANDAIADKVLSVCNLNKRKVPEDIAIIGVDNNEMICTNATPTLSSIAPDFELGGYLAAEMLDRMFRDKRTTDQKVATFGPITLVRRASTTSPSAYNGIALRIVEHIRNAEGCTSPAKIFSELKCSRRTAELHFRKATGKSILEAINEVRYESACLLLRQRLLPISIIAKRIGYDSVIAFDRFFKSRAGKTPTEWRNP